PTAAVATTDGQHTYHIEITNDVVLATYDGKKVLDGFTYGDGDVFGPTRRILWGEGPDEAYGTSIWQQVETNGAVCDPNTSTTTSTTTVSTTTSPGATVTTSTTGTGDTTTETTGSTTTTTLPPGCEDSASGSLDGILCRLTALDASVQATPELG